MNNRVKWQPVEYGWLHLENKELNKEFDAIEVRQSAFEPGIPNNGVLLTISEQWGEREASVYLPDNIRLCRAVEAEADAGVAVPPEVAEAIQTIVDDCVFSPNHDAEGWQEELAVLRKWLKQQEGGASGTSSMSQMQKER